MKYYHIGTSYNFNTQKRSSLYFFRHRNKVNKKDFLVRNWRAYYPIV